MLRIVNHSKHLTKVLNSAPNVLNIQLKIIIIKQSNSKYCMSLDTTIDPELGLLINPILYLNFMNSEARNQLDSIKCTLYLLIFTTVFI